MRYPATCLQPALCIAAALALSACGHAWPEHAKGGLAERGRPVDALFAATHTAIEEARLGGSGGRARVAQAQAHYVLAVREREAGLSLDAEDSLLSASIALGGVDRIEQTRPHCLKEPCR